MIDFITMSTNVTNQRKLEHSIAAGLGSAAGDWRLEVVDGTEADLFAGYNRGAARTDGEILIFVHDDVELLGNVLTFQKPLELVQRESTGFVGVAGTRCLHEHGWWHKNELGQNGCRAGLGMAAHLNQGNEFGMHWNVWPCPSIAGHFGRVVVLDGVFLMCSRAAFERLDGFDEEHYTGLHYYDIDITFRATLEGLHNYAAPIPLLHHSRGANPALEEGRQMFLSRFGDRLPLSVAQ